MAASYKKLWKLLIDKEMKKKELEAKAGFDMNLIYDSVLELREKAYWIWKRLVFVINPLRGVGMMAKMP